MKPDRRALPVAIALALHAVAIGMLLQSSAVRQSLAENVPIMASVLLPSPPRIEAPKPRPLERIPAPVQSSQRTEPLPILTAAPTTPGPSWSAPAPKAEPPSVLAAAAPRASLGAPAALTPSVPPTIVPPVFDAAYLQNPPPAYPPMSRRRREQGRVLLRVFVSAGGTAERIEIRESSSHERLDQAASEAVQGWRFVPARQGDKPVAAWVLVPITFSLGA